MQGTSTAAGLFGAECGGCIAEQRCAYVTSPEWKRRVQFAPHGVAVRVT